MENENENPNTDAVQTPTEKEVIFKAFATALRALPGYGATVSDGKRSLSLKVITPAGTSFNVTAK